MKKSTLSFATAIVLIILVCSAPQLVGYVCLKEPDRDTPADYISALWIKASGINPVADIAIEEPFRHIKIVGNGHFCNLHLLQADSTKIHGSRVYELGAQVIKDTLIMRPKGSVYIAVNTNNNILSIHIDHSNLQIRADEYSDTLSIHANRSSAISLAPLRSNTTDSAGKHISHLHLYLKDKSTAEIDQLNIDKIHATVHHSELSYSAGLKSDTLDVTLFGKSIVRSNAPKHINQIKNLIVKDDKQYFKPELVGQGVNLITE